jgi:hypothetical protein
MNQQLTIIEEFESKLTDIKDKLKSEGITSVVFNELSSNAKLLQTKLDELLRKKGIMTQSDIDDAYATLSEYKRKELELMNKKATTKAIVYGSIVVLGIVLIYKFLKK